MDIRVATLEDVQIVAKLAIQMWKSHTIEELAREFYDYISKEKGRVFIAVADAGAVGFAQCGLRHDYVEGVFCKPFLHKIAKSFCRLLHLHFVGNCKREHPKVCVNLQTDVR